MSAPQCTFSTDASVCRQLTIAHGLESACGVLTFVVCMFLALKVHVGRHIDSPGAALARLCAHKLRAFAGSLVGAARALREMPRASLDTRLSFSAGLDEAVNVLGALFAFLAMTRWLELGSVNGMRYVGHVFVCPLTQFQLTVLLAPFMPYYLCTSCLAVLASVALPLAGYSAALLRMPVYTGDALKFMETLSLDSLEPTMKLATLSPAFGALVVLSFILLPYYWAIYTVHGGEEHDDLPAGYRGLLAIVWLTLCAFPVWWMLSWEGMGLVDAWLTEVGFTVLTVASKGLITLQNIRMGAYDVEDRSPVGEARPGGGVEVKKAAHHGRCVESLPIEGERPPAPPTEVYLRRASMASAASAVSYQLPDESDIVVKCESLAESQSPLRDFLRRLESPASNSISSDESDNNSEEDDKKVYTVYFG